MPSSFRPWELARLEEARQALAVAETSVESLDLAGGKVCYSEPNSWQNFATNLAMDGPITDAELDRVLEFYAERDALPKVEISPFADPSLVEGLAARGFFVDDFETVLFRELGPPTLGPRWPAGATVRALDTERAEDVDTFLELQERGFVTVAVGPLTHANRRVLRHPRTHALLVELESAPVATALYEVAPPLVALMGGTVLADHRGLGLQAALIAHRCELGRSAGCSVATIQSRPAATTARNAIRAGFHVAYTKTTLSRRG